MIAVRLIAIHGVALLRVSLASGSGGGQATAAFPHRRSEDQADQRQKRQNLRRASARFPCQRGYQRAKCEGHREHRVIDVHQMQLVAVL